MRASGCVCILKKESNTESTENAQSTETKD
jgi:hypothetical protein